jgi:hypothetical protein
VTSDVSSANEVTDQYGCPDTPGQDQPNEDPSQIAGTEQDHTVTQGSFSPPEVEYPDGTVLIWRMERPHALGVAIRDDRLCEAAGLGEHHWWSPSGAATWDELVLLARGATPPIVRRAWGHEWPHTSESAADTLARLGTSAQLWAREFVRRFGGDEHLLLTWFASAIETGRSAGYARGRDDQAAGVGSGWRVAAEDAEASQ